MAKPYGTPVANCPKCGKVVGAQHPYSHCSECGEPFPESVLVAIPSKRDALQAARSEREATAARNARLARAPSIILTTAGCVEGYRVSQTLDIITAEYAFGTNVLQDVFASLTDVFGGRSAATQQVLRDARRICLDELRREAADIEADAVIAVDLDYSEFSGQGKSTLFLVASGTAVRLRQSE